MSTVTINPPKTPVTTKSKGIAVAALPNVCKMPPPPPPFCPTPLPNIGKSDDSPKGYTKTVKVEGGNVAIRGATFGSKGDIASKPTGGGIVSANTHGPTAFVSPGSMDVVFEDKAVQLLGDAMTNNNGSPPNSSTPMEGQAPGSPPNLLPINCKNAPEKAGSPKYTDCEKEEICAKCDSVNEQAKVPGLLKRLDTVTYDANRALGDKKCDQLKGFAKRNSPRHEELGGFKHLSPKCEQELSTQAKTAKPPYTGFSPDHVQEIQLGGHPESHANLRWMSSAPNSWMGGKLQQFKVGEHAGVKPDCCDK